MNIELLKDFITKNNIVLFNELLSKTIEINNEYKDNYSCLYNYIFMVSSNPEQYIIKCLECKIPIVDMSCFLLDCSIYRLPLCIKAGLESGCIDMSNNEHYEYFQSFLLDCIYDTTFKKEEIPLYLSCIITEYMISNDIKSICNMMNINGKQTMFSVELEHKSIELEKLDLFTPSYYMNTVLEGCLMLKKFMYKTIEDKLKEY